MASRRERAAPRSDLLARVGFAIPAVLFAILIVGEGGLVFAIGIFGLGVVALVELYTLMKRVQPVNLAGFLTLGGMIFAALYGEPRHVLFVLTASFPLTFWLSFFRARGARTCPGRWPPPTSACSGWGSRWCTRCSLRETPHGDGLLVDVLVATFLGDTAAYFGGRMYGRTRLAPSISPNKTRGGPRGRGDRRHARVLAGRPLPGLAHRARTPCCSGSAWPWRPPWATSSSR